MRSANEIFPELKDLPPLPIHEMALRLCFLYDDHDKHPEHEDIPGCALTLFNICNRCQDLHAYKIALCSGRCNARQSAQCQG